MGVIDAGKGMPVVQAFAQEGPHTGELPGQSGRHDGRVDQPELLRAPIWRGQSENKIRLSSSNAAFYRGGFKQLLQSGFIDVNNPGSLRFNQALCPANRRCCGVFPVIALLRQTGGKPAQPQQHQQGRPLHTNSVVFLRM